MPQEPRRFRVTVQCSAEGGYARFQVSGMGDTRWLSEGSANTKREGVRRMSDRFHRGVLSGCRRSVADSIPDAVIANMLNQRREVRRVHAA